MKEIALLLVRAKQEELDELGAKVITKCRDIVNILCFMIDGEYSDPSDKARRFQIVLKRWMVHLEEKVLEALKQGLEQDGLGDRFQDILKEDRETIKRLWANLVLKAFPETDSNPEVKTPIV